MRAKLGCAVSNADAAVDVVFVETDVSVVVDALLIESARAPRTPAGLLSFHGFFPLASNLSGGTPHPLF